MYKHILIATDGSELATKGLVHGVSLAKSVGAAVTIVTVTEMWPAMEMARESTHDPLNAIKEFEDAAARSAQHILSAAAAKAKDLGLEASTEHVPDLSPAEGIVETAKAKGCDLIVMASHGRRGVSRLFLGSQAMEVLSHTPVPVLIVR